MKRPIIYKAKSERQSSQGWLSWYIAKTNNLTS